MDQPAALRIGADAAWDAAWAELGFVSPPGLREQVAAAYAEPTRLYHDRRHLDECCAHLAPVADRLDRPAEVVLALWFHDGVYDPRRPDNETRSAGWAADSLRRAGVAPGPIASIRTLILATRHDAPPPTRDAEYLVDADLAILGAGAERFDEYERQVRREYAWVDDAAFRAGRAAVLRGFLDRPAIYATAASRDRLEAAARGNLARSLGRLAEGGAGAI